MADKKIKYTDPETLMTGVKINSPAITWNSKKFKELVQNDCASFGNITDGFTQIDFYLSASLDDIEKTIMKIAAYLNEKEREIEKNITNRNKWCKKLVKDITGKYGTKVLNIGLHQTYKMNDNGIKNAVISIQSTDENITIDDNHKTLFPELLNHNNQSSNDRYDTTVEDGCIYIDISYKKKKGEIVNDIGQIFDILYNTYSKHDVSKIVRTNQIIEKCCDEAATTTNDPSIRFLNRYTVDENGNIRYPTLLITSKNMHSSKDVLSIHLNKKPFSDFIQDFELRDPYNGLACILNITLKIEDITNLESNLNELYRYLSENIENIFKPKMKEHIDWINDLTDSINNGYNHVINMDAESKNIRKISVNGINIHLMPNKTIQNINSINISNYNTIKVQFHIQDIFTIHIPWTKEKQKVESEIRNMCEDIYNLYLKDIQHKRPYIDKMTQIIQEIEDEYQTYTR